MTLPGPDNTGHGGGMHTFSVMLPDFFCKACPSLVAMIIKSTFVAGVFQIEIRWPGESVWSMINPSERGEWKEKLFPQCKPMIRGAGPGKFQKPV